MCYKPNCNCCGRDDFCEETPTWDSVEQAVNDVWSTKQRQITELVQRAEVAEGQSEASATASAGSAAEAKDYRDQAQSAATASIEVMGTITEAATSVQESAEAAQNAVANISVRTWFYTTTANNQTVINLPQSLNALTVQYLVINGLRKDLNRGFWFNKTLMQVTLAAPVPINTEIVFVLGIYNSDNPQSFPAILSSDAGAQYIGSRSGNNLQTELDIIEGSFAQVKLNWSVLNGFVSSDLDFKTGGTLSVNDRNKVVYDFVSRNWYSYIGPLPVTFPANFNPVNNANWKAQVFPTIRSDLSSAVDGLGDSMITTKQPYTGSVPVPLHDKVSQLRSAKDFGAEGFDTADRTVEINNAFATFGAHGNGELYLETGSHIVNENLLNPYGVETTGPGYLAVPKAVGVRRLTSYADKHKYCFGKEYLYAVYNRMKMGQGVMDGRVNIFMYGDSTLHGGNGEAFNLKPENWISALFRYAGAPNVYVTNRAVPGTKVESLDTGTDLGPNTKLLIIKYGVNDAAYPKDVRHQIFMEQLNLKLAAIRTKPYGDVKSLSIILMGPNTTNDSPNGRDEEWYETIRGIYVAAARKFQCAFFDTYALFRDPNGAAGAWLDQPPQLGTDIGIHPVDEGNMWIYGELFDQFFSPNKLAYFSANTKWNLPGIVEGIAYTASPLNLYRASETWHTISVLNGWPVSGLCRGYLSIDGVITQTIHDNLSSRVYHRSAKPGNTAWNPMTGVPADLSMGNGWVAAGVNYNSPAVILTRDGTAILRGAIRSGTVAAGTAMFTIPVGYRPLKTSRHVVPTGVGAASAVIELTANGQCSIVGGADNALLFLEGVTYSV